MKKGECKTGMKVFVRGCPSYRATVRAISAEDVHLEWSKAAQDYQAELSDRPLPNVVGYADVTQVLDAPEPTVLEPAAPEPAPAAGLQDPLGRWTEWGNLWHRFEKIVEDRRQVAKELQPYGVVTDDKLAELQGRVLGIRAMLADLKLDATTFLERMYNELSF